MAALTSSANTPYVCMYVCARMRACYVKNGRCKKAVFFYKKYIFVKNISFYVKKGSLFTITCKKTAFLKLYSCKKAGFLQKYIFVKNSFFTIT